MHRDVLSGTADDDNVTDIGTVLERFIDVVLERNDLAASVSSVGSEHRNRARVVDAIANRFG